MKINLNVHTFYTKDAGMKANLFFHTIYNSRCFFLMYADVFDIKRLQQMHREDVGMEANNLTIFKYAGTKANFNIRIFHSSRCFLFIFSDVFSVIAQSALFVIAQSTRCMRAASY